MAEVDRDNLARGVFLEPDHVFPPIEDMRDELNDSDISVEQLQTPRAPFRVHLPITFIEGRYIEAGRTRLLNVTGATADTVVTAYSIPFVLPPTQDHWDTTVPFAGVLDASTPLPVLDEVHFSFDQRDERATITSQYWGDVAGGPYLGDRPNSGLLDYDHIDRYNFRLSLYSRRPLKLDPYLVFGDYVDQTRLRLEDEIFSVDIPYTAYSGYRYRDNPFHVENINRVCNPYHTFVVVLECQGLFDNDNPTERLALCNPTVSLAFSMPLLARDFNTTPPTFTPSTHVQNIPIQHHGQKPAGTIAAISAPVGGDEIVADGADGLNTNASVVDQVFRRKLGGGYTRWSSNYGRENELEHDAAYGVIAVPMWSNQQEGEVNHNTIDWVAGSGAAAHIVPICDRRRIWLSHPIVIHHVIAAVNYQTNLTDVTYPLMDGTDDMIHTIGVGIFSAVRSDEYAYQQVAGLTWTLDQTGLATTHLSRCIDRVGIPHAGGADWSPPGAGLWDPFVWELMDIPIVRDPGIPGVGWGPNTGIPFFAGQRCSGSFGSSDIGNGAVSQASAILGREQMIEVRWQIEAGPESGPGPPPDPQFDSVGGPGAANALMVGQGGHWVYLIVKRHLCGGGGGR